MITTLRLRLIGALSVLCLVHLLAAIPVAAQKAPDRLAQLTISVWLEYDRPGALYIYRGQLPGDAGLPARLAFRLPARTGGPSSTAGIDASGKFRYIRPTLGRDGEAVTVSYDVNWPHFQLEYYDNALLIQDANRQLDFVYKADYAIEQLVLEVKEPYGAASFTLQPPADSRSQGDEDGLLVHRRVIGPMAAGQVVTWKVAYTRSDSRLTTEALGIATPGPTSYEAVTSPATTHSASDVMIWALIGLLGTGTLGSLALALHNSSRRPVRVPEKAAPHGGPKKGRRKRAPEVTAQPAKVERAPRKKRSDAPQVRPAQFCPDCGAGFGKSDQFCRRCGTRRRGA